MMATVSETYHSSIFEIRRSRFGEFCNIVDKMLDRNQRMRNKGSGGGVIRKKAGDNWF